MNEAQDKSQDLSTRESSLVSEGTVTLELTGETIVKQETQRQYLRLWEEEIG